MSMNVSDFLEFQEFNPSAPDEGEIRLYTRLGKLMMLNHANEETPVHINYIAGGGIELVPDSGNVIVRCKFASNGSLVADESGAVTVASGGVTLDMMDNMPAGTVMVNDSAEPGRPKAITFAALKSILDSLE